MLRPVEGRQACGRWAQGCSRVECTGSGGFQLDELLEAVVAFADVRLDELLLDGGGCRVVLVVEQVGDECGEEARLDVHRAWVVAVARTAIGDGCF